MSDIRVSVLCTTYNQQDTVARMLDSILCQDINFTMEILVHDDASTDATAAVLQDYQKCYPEIIRLFLEETNRFNDASIAGYFTSLLAPKAQGEYLAFCEGDDYWCDPHKLQRQYDYMNSHPACSEYVHQALRVEPESGQTIDLIGMGASEVDLSAGQVISGWNVPTASRFVRKARLADYAKTWIFDKPAGDFPLAVYLASKGYIHHDPMVASVYEYQRPNSYSSRTLSEEGIVQIALRWLVMLQEIDIRTNHLYHEPLIGHAIQYTNIVVEHGESAKAHIGLGSEALGRLGFDEFGNRHEPEPVPEPVRQSLVRRVVNRARRWLRESH